MAYSRASVPELENLLKYGKKKIVLVNTEVIDAYMENFKD